MALAFDALTTDTFQASTTSRTFNHTCTGTDRALFVGIYTGSDISDATLTYNSVAMTFVAIRDIGNGERVAVWKLAAPASGSNAVLFTRGSAAAILMVAVSYTGADQTNPVHGSTTEQETAATITPAVTASISNCWAVCFTTAGAGYSSIGTGTVRRASNNPGVFDSAATFSSSYAFSVTFLGSGQTGSVILAIQPPLPLAYTVTAAVGAFTLTGVAAALSAGFKVAAAVGSFVLTGVDASLTSARTAAAGLGTFALTGVAATLTSARAVAAEVGAFVLTGLASLLRTSAWGNQTASTSSWSDQSRTASTWDNQDKS